MQFIEWIFHVAPDGGTGILELTIALVFLIFPIAIVGLRRSARGRS